MLAQVRRLPAAPGVYRFRDERGRVLYVGRATDLRARAGSYFSALRDRPHLRRMVRQIARVEAVACDSVHEAAWLERNLLEHAMPRWNRTAGGQEVPLYLRLDPGPARPGLRAVHEPRPGSFGPYLGGVRARAAVGALHRLFPLPYAGAGLTGAERDMAARLGVTAADRNRLLAGVQAVLRRDPAAVAAAAARLTALRDTASAALHFEHAGRLQEEIRALDWVTCPQRVTAPDGDFAVAGWSGGVGVRFTVRAGRLCEWTQRPSASPTVTDGPPGWPAFARRTAELAAALISGSPYP